MLLQPVTYFDLILGIKNCGRKKTLQRTLQGF